MVCRTCRSSLCERRQICGRKSALNSRANELKVNSTLSQRQSPVRTENKSKVKNGNHQRKQQQRNKSTIRPSTHPCSAIPRTATHRSMIQHKYRSILEYHTRRASTTLSRPSPIRAASLRKPRRSIFRPHRSNRMFASTRRWTTWRSASIPSC